ncbi:MAG: SCO family protein [Caldilineaceae bacterium]|nr:SCO family protein [Caldilineaceae bacterium]
MSTTTNLDTPIWQQETLRVSYIWYALLALPLVGLIAFVIFQPIQVLPRISLAPGYSFVDQDGQRFSNEELLGKLVIYNFIYTRCGEVCERSSAAMRDMQQMTRDVGLPVEFVTISFDPEHDTPEHLRAYAAKLDADTSNWHFVTGDPTRLKNVIGNSFRTYYQAKDDGSFAFDPAFVLVDGLGVLRAKYRTATPDLETVHRDLGLIVEEVENSDGATRYVYEAAHLFLCFPQ